MSDVKAVPDGFNSVSVYLVVPDTSEALALYSKALGAETMSQMKGPDGRTMHAEIRIGNSTVMLTDENPRWGALAPISEGGSGASHSIHVYTEDCDALFARALEAGCEEVYPMMDAFWGDRYGKLKDPYGHVWGIATHKEDLSQEEISRRGEEWFASMGQEPGEG